MQNLKKNKKIGILGGTFNPIHMGHLIMAEIAREKMKLEKVLFIPTGMSYMKDTSEILSSDIRMNMLKLSIDTNPFFEISDIEVKREGNTYTYETLELLKQQYPEYEIYFIVGADCLFSIENWYLPDRIFQNCILLAANRDNKEIQELNVKIEFLKEVFNANVVLIDIPTIDISSTAIRNNLRNNISIRYMVHDNVFQYIHENNLYQ